LQPIPTCRVNCIRCYSNTGRPVRQDTVRKRPRQFQCAFEAAACRLSHETGVRGHGLRTCSLYCRPGGARRLRCTRGRRWRSKRRGCTCSYFALPPAVFPHPRCSLCWITIGHTFYSDAYTVYRAPSVRFGTGPPNITNAMLKDNSFSRYRVGHYKRRQNAI
jgi:hypothetical protein